MQNLIKIYKDKGQLEALKIERAQIAKHIQAAYQDLNEAKTTFKVSDKAAYFFAYTAMLKIGRALLFLKGYRPKGQGQHETVVETAGSILGPQFNELTKQFDRMRKKRNRLMYDIGDLVSHSDADKAFRAAEEFVNRTRKFMEESDPQLKLELR
jgi:uncharacterized protein (UPF0332 family)